MATGPSSTIGWHRERARMQRRIDLCAWDHDAIDRYNELSRLIEQARQSAPVLQLLKGGRHD